MVRESIQIRLNVTNALSQRNKIIGYQKIYRIQFIPPIRQPNKRKIGSGGL
jgi:hypothetical protein